jgi:hypothetical protein
MELMNIAIQKGFITSLELAEQINAFRKQEGKAAILAHGDLIKIIKNELDEEIAAGEVSSGSYKDKNNQARPMYIIPLEQAKQILTRESKMVRKAVMKYIRALEQELINNRKSDVNLQELIQLATINYQNMVEYNKTLIETNSRMSVLDSKVDTIDKRITKIEVAIEKNEKEKKHQIDEIRNANLDMTRNIRLVNIEYYKAKDIAQEANNRMNTTYWTSHKVNKSLVEAGVIWTQENGSHKLVDSHIGTGLTKSGLVATDWTSDGVEFVLEVLESKFAEL